MRADYLLWNCISLIQLWRGLFLRTSSHIAPYPLPFTATEPSAALQHTLPTRNSYSLRAPFVREDPTGAVRTPKGNHPRVWMSGLEVRTIQYRHKMSYCNGLPEVSCVTFWETLEATELFLSKHIDTTDVKKKAHTVNEPTANPNALRS